MFKHLSKILIFLLVITLNVDQYSCQLSVSPSWFLRGTSVQNNTVLTFNKDDTLFLSCVARTPAAEYTPIMAVTKGSAPPSNMNVTYNADGSASLVYSDAQTIIYDDFLGVYDGYENIVFLQKSLVGAVPQYDYKLYMNIGVLRPADAGTYYCSAALLRLYGAYYVSAFSNSGSVTIQVNTKPGQAHSNRANSHNFLTYSAILLSASKLLL